MHLCWKYYQPHYIDCTAAIRTGLSCLRRLWLWAHAVIWCYERCYKCYEWCYKHCETCYMCCSPRCDLVPLVVLCLQLLLGRAAAMEISRSSNGGSRRMNDIIGFNASCNLIQVKA